MNPSPSVKALGSGLFFLLELATYAVALWWAFAFFSTWPLRILVAVAAPAALVSAWILLGAPKATWHLTGVARAALLAVWFGSAVAALAALGRPGLAAGFALAAIAVSAGDLAWQ